jgi:gas vesicle protein
MAHGDLHKAVDFWERARPLFEHSSQAKQVQHRLAGVSKDVLEQHRNNLAHLVELNAPTRTVEELESDIEDLDKVDISDEKEFDLIAA